ncbi:sensor domain-containing diguanylate cyclase, partial [Escherichia coli]
FTLLAILLALGLVLMRQINHSVRTEAELMRTRDQLTSINRTLEELALLDGRYPASTAPRCDNCVKHASAHFLTRYQTDGGW